MRYPNYLKEKALQAKGFKLIAGLDEAGRGAWAGPITASAVILDPKIKIAGLRDSKLLTAKSRERLFEIIIKKALAYAVAMISQKEIDAIGLGPANILAMTQALAKLSLKPDYLLIDALRIKYENLPFEAVIDGDYKICSIAAASILAKVSRDRLMVGYEQAYPGWGFAKHKGYGTKEHFDNICRKGLCSLHRFSFRPVKELSNRNNSI